MDRADASPCRSSLVNDPLGDGPAGSGTAPLCEAIRLASSGNKTGSAGLTFAHANGHCGVMFRFRFVAILLAAAGLGAEFSLPTSAADPPTRMVYRVQHSKYGDVGTYTNTVEKAADSTTVNTQGRIK